MEARPVIVITGPTASGKTQLAIDLAEKYGGEIICADSRTIYKRMDIGTAKPTKEDQAKVPHWGIDIIEPNQRYSAAEFKSYANEKISEIRSRGHIPFLVGGTGLYIDSVIFDYDFGPPANQALRNMLESFTLPELHKYCSKNNVTLPENKNNKRYVIRAIEQKNINKKRREIPVENTIIVGIATDLKMLRARIEGRSEQLFNDGVVEEAKKIAEAYGWGHESMTGNVYRLCHDYLSGTVSYDDMRKKFVTLDWRLAKRQLTWLKRNRFIKWLSLESANDYLSAILASEQ